jgi:hypothetical protein
MRRRKRIGGINVVDIFSFSINWSAFTESNLSITTTVPEKYNVKPAWRMGDA